MKSRIIDLSFECPYCTTPLKVQFKKHDLKRALNKDTIPLKVEICQ